MSSTKVTITKMTKKRNRAVSLSVDWDNIVKDDEDQKGGEYYLSSSIIYDRPTVDFCTGSSYSGKWNALGMAVFGSYIFPHGCEYEGGFEDGMFHGEGTLMYPMGQKLDGIWDKGKMISYRFSHVDGLDYIEPWAYCKMPDRRFYVSIREGLQPAGMEFLTNQQPTRPIEPGCYDTGDGFFNPLTKSIMINRDPEDYENLEDRDSVVVEQLTCADTFWVNAITVVSPRKEEWIKKNCRVGGDIPAGYRPDLYEDWISGRKTDLDYLKTKYTPEEQSEADSFSESDRRRLTSCAGSEVEESEEWKYAGTGRKLVPSRTELVPPNKDS